jgi:hypothetical protein
MLSGVGVEYSHRDLFAITSNVGVKLCTVESPKAKVVGRESGDLGFDLAFLRFSLDLKRSFLEDSYSCITLK